MTALGKDKPIGLIGTGLLGTAMAERLLGAGYSVLAWNRTRSRADAILQRGARWSDNPLADSDRVLISLYTTDVVQSVLAELGSLRPGQILIDTTTGDPDQTSTLGSELAEVGVRYLEAPIAASSEQTRCGEAVAILAGPDDTVHDCADLVQAIAAKSFHVGPWGSAAKMKLVNNLILGLNRAALAEGLAFAEAIGLAKSDALAVLKEGNAYSVVMDVKGRKMVEEDFTTQAKLSQHLKDVRLILQEGERAGRYLPFSILHRQILEQLEAAGLGELDNCAIIRAFDENRSDHLG